MFLVALCVHPADKLVFFLVVAIMSSKMVAQHNYGTRNSKRKPVPQDNNIKDKLARPTKQTKKKRDKKDKEDKNTSSKQNRTRSEIPADKENVPPPAISIMTKENKCETNTDGSMYDINGKKVKTRKLTKGKKVVVFVTSPEKEQNLQNGPATVPQECQESPPPEGGSCTKQAYDSANSKETRSLPSLKSNLFSPESSKKKRRVDDTPLSLTTKKGRSPATDRNGVFCRLPLSMSYDEENRRDIQNDYDSLLSGLSHEAFSYFQNNKKNSTSGATFCFSNGTNSFPIAGSVVLDNDTKRRLERDIDTYEKNNSKLLQFSYSMIDFFGQAVLCGLDNQESSYFLAPASMYEFIREDPDPTANKKLMDITECNSKRKCMQIDLLQKKVIDMTVYGSKHFSKVVIVNPYQIIERARFKKCSDSDLAPVIFVLDTMCGSSQHNPDVVGKFVIKYLNKLDKHTNGSGGRNFKKNLIPVVKIDGKKQQSSSA